MKTVNSKVLVAYSDHGTALDDQGELRQFKFRKGIERPLAGDCVDIDDEGRLESIRERTTLFGRGDHQGTFKATAANIDQLLIVIAPEPAPSHDLITRYLVMAELQQISAIVVLNKSDLPIPNRAPFNELSLMESLGYPVLQVSAHQPHLLKTLSDVVRNKSSLLAGQSGVGKSSLLNALIPNVGSLTNQLSRATGKGRHTTTTTRFYPLPEGGYLVDSPGVWEYGLWVIPLERLEQAFVDFRPYVGLCRFRNCTHSHEPGCAIIGAVESGNIHPSRHHAWCRLLAEQQRYVR